MNFRNGYDKERDVTMDEYNARQVDLYYEETEPVSEPHSFTDEDSPPLDWEDCSYFYGIPDYDRFGRPSWEV
jgi:5-methylcytosine-specific restriction endonuclease McrBC GTP-binding regulatory subunit McrB